jgi:photosystem II stability/assembly factor-like uncharacterized protein
VNSHEPRTLIVAVALALASHLAFAGAGVWTTDGPISPDSAGGVPSLVTDPGRPGRVYAGTTKGSVFRSVDGGATWETASRGLPPINLSALAIDHQEGTLYAGYGGFCQLLTNCTSGLFTSGDGGATWIGINFPGGVEAIAVDPTDSRVLYAAGETIRSLGPPFPLGVFRSTDGGKTWTSAGGPGPVSSLAVDPSHPGTLWAIQSGTPTGGATYRSDDDGASWIEVSFGTAPSPGGHVIAFDPFRQGTGFIGTENGLYRISSGGTLPLLAGSAGLAVLSIAFDADDPDALMIGTKNGIYQTRDEGATFFAAPGPSGPILSLTEIASRPTQFIAGTGTGISRSADSGLSWQSANSGLWYTTVTDLVAIPATSSGLRALSGVHKFNSEVVFNERTGSGGAWTVIPTNLSDFQSGSGFSPFGTLTQAQDLPQRLYLLASHDSFCGGVLRSADGGRTWNEVSSPTCARSIAVSPVDADEVFVGGFFDEPSYKSLDGANSWTETLEGGGLVFHIQFAPSQHSTLYAISTDFNGLSNLHRTTDSGSTWIDFGRPQAPGPSVLAVDTSNPLVVYVAVQPATIYRSGDGGNTWTRAGEPELSPVRTLLADPTRPGRLWAAGEGGVFVSNDRGDSWSPLNAGLADLSVLNLVLDPSGRSLHAGTATRGVFDLELTPDRAKITAPLPGRPPSRTVSRVR